MELNHAPMNPKREELTTELAALQKRNHDLNEQMITSTIDPIKFHYSIQGNEARQRAILQELEGLKQSKNESENKINQSQIENESNK